MNYQEAWDFLDGLQLFKIKLGLDGMRLFLDAAGLPLETLRFIHVAGTNGKGSVSATLSAILVKAGFRVGLYTSPHLSSVRERFRINNEMIPEADFARLMTSIRDTLACHADGQITYFECTTALALLWFAREQVDVAILEVGMGGRLDATNVVRPEVGIITNVTMDHEAYLGNTLAEVASEKAGIIKPGVPLVSGVAPDVTREVVSETCRDRGAPLYLLGTHFSVEGSVDDWSYHGLVRHLSGLRCVLRGGHQLANAAIALAALEILGRKDFVVDQEAIREGLQAVSWPGRLELLELPGPGVGNDSRQYLLDGAHNPDGVLALKKALETDWAGRRLILIWASMADKDLKNTLPVIAPLCHQIILTTVHGERAATPEQLLDFVPESLRTQTRCTPSIPAALGEARALSTPADLICIAGSLYLVGEARELLLKDQAAKEPDHAP